VAGEEATDRPVANRHAFVPKRSAQLFDRDVGLSFEESEDRVFVRLDPARPAISALDPGAGLTPLARERSPSADARGADPEPFARLPMVQSLRHRGQHANPKIKR
jgi:hypothetical protein